MTREKLKYQDEKARRFHRVGGLLAGGSIASEDTYVMFKLSDVINFHKDFPLMLAANGLSIEIDLRTGQDLCDSKSILEDGAAATTPCSFDVSDINFYTHELVPPESVSRSIIQKAAVQEHKLAFTSFEGQRLDVNSNGQTYQISSIANRVSDTIVQFVNVTGATAFAGGDEKTNRDLELSVIAKAKYGVSFMPPLERMQLEVNGIYYNGSTWADNPSKFLMHIYQEYKQKTGADIQFEEWLVR